MSTSRRNFIKQTVSAASIGLMLPKESEARDPLVCPSLTTDPDIRVLFSGMLLYRFYPDTGSEEVYTHCDISPLKLSDFYKHHFSVMVKARQGTGAPYTLWRYFGKPDEPLTLSVDVGGSPRVGVRKRTPTPEPFVRGPGNDEKDWRWTLRIDEFRGSEAKPGYKDGELRPRLRITNGLFYTAIKTDPRRTYVSRTAHNEAPVDLYSVGSVVGANICLEDRGEDRGKAILAGGPEGPITMEKLSGVSYEIYVEYDPRKPIFPTSTTSDTPSHFHKYYDAMKDPKPKRYNVLYRDQAGRDKKIPLATPDVPCMGLEG